jgi:hypothetical protein
MMTGNWANQAPRDYGRPSARISDEINSFQIVFDWVGEKNRAPLQFHWIKSQYASLSGMLTLGSSDCGCFWCLAYLRFSDGLANPNLLVGLICQAQSLEINSIDSVSGTCIKIVLPLRLKRKMFEQFDRILRTSNNPPLKYGFHRNQSLLMARWWSYF